LVILMFEAARVNDRADKLSVELGTSTWATAEKEQQRMKLFISYAANPISMSVLGTRPTRGSVYVKIAGYVLALATGFMTQYIQHNIR
jgi:hypothetical protein